MSNLVRNFIKGRMNKSVDERLVPQGEYINAENIRMGSTEDSEIGAVENTKGNTQLTTLVYPPTGTVLSDNATCIGAYSDDANETLYWFVHDPSFTEGATGKLDLIVSFNTRSEDLVYHIVSIDDGGGDDTTLNFNPQYLITGINLVDGLLFFTDDANPPRRINVTRSYPQPVANIDDNELGDRVMVLKGIPLASPSLALIEVDNSQNNYMEERIICFAYRYRYEEGEYSATSQFTGPAFTAGSFFFSAESLTNEGMENQTNNALVTINTGGNLVKGFDLLFKEMDDSIVRVIERFDKQQDGIPDDSTFTYEFDNSKIFTILPESEILRLYDNVPRLAQAQTLMGNRLVYGNYLEGYDLIERPGVPIRLNYFVTHIKEELGNASVSFTISNATTYLLDGQGLTPNLTMEITITDFTNVEMGDTFEISVEANHESWTTVSGTSPTSTVPVDSVVSWTYTVDADYNTLADMCTSPGFSNSLGTPTNIETDPALYANSDQSIFTNAWNNIFPLTATGGTPDPQNLVGTGVNQIGDSILGTVVSDDTFRLLFPIPKYTSGGTTSYESVGLSESTSRVNYYSVGAQRSLHSNRSYEVGIVYMDAYGRSSTALVSERNQIHIPCGDSIFRNQARVQIPYWNPAPYWAETYKFVIKPDREGYETIYSNYYFENGGTKYFLLEGEQAAKAEKGDRYVVKSDAGGAITSCEYITVLEKSIIGVGALNETPPLPAIAGTYISVKSAETNIDTSVDFPFYDSGSQKECAGVLGGLLAGLADVPLVEIGNIPTYAINAGTRITIVIKTTRGGTGDGNNACESRYMKLEESFTVLEDYTDFADWFYGNPEVVARLQSHVVETGGNTEYPVMVISSGPLPSGVQQPDSIADGGVFIKVSTSNGISFDVKGTGSCGSATGAGFNSSRKGCVKVRVQIVPANETIVFETEPQNAFPDLWYESSESYDIVYDAVTGNRYHRGNLQNQSATQNAIVDTGFFNCITYGNGIESYKIRDSITGKPITLGNRVTTVSEQDYKEIRRFADLTYSGVYNDETNLNKLNEFNLGLLNFKPLEDSYGPVAKLFGRRTDILTLQEDKISYVLAGKNLLTDSTGESVVTSIPEVLGTQVARVEDFGISNNPESFAERGPHKFFTDAKRGAVIHLFGEGQKEQLLVASENGMRSWFRDEFIASFNTQKLGGYDPYMNEYVLASSDTLLPGPPECIPCGVTQTFLLSSPGQSFCVDVGDSVGDVTVSYTISQDNPADTIDISTTYPIGAAPVVTSGISESNPTAIPIIDKNTVQNGVVNVDVDYAGTDRFILSITVSCPDADQITVKLVTLTRPSQSGQLIHNEYRWDAGSFNSPLHSEQIKFAVGSTLPVMSQFAQFSGSQGGGIIPTDGANVEMRYNRFGNDNYILDPADRFYYLRSNTDYANTPVDIEALRAAALPATGIVPAGGPALYTGNFTMPATGDFLYLIWDYSSALPTALCFSASKVGACCECVCDPANCQQYTVYNASSSNMTVEYTECGGGTEYVTIAGKNTISLCSDTYPVAISGQTDFMQVTITNCEC